MISKKARLKLEFIRRYLDNLMQADIDMFGHPAPDNYHFMQRYLSVCLSLSSEDRAEYLPEPIDYPYTVVSSRLFIFDKSILEDKEKFFELFYYYKGLKSL